MTDWIRHHLSSEESQKACDRYADAILADSFLLSKFMENLLASCQGYHDREENRYSNSAIEERLKLLTEMNGLGIRLSY